MGNDDNWQSAKKPAKELVERKREMNFAKISTETIFGWVEYGFGWIDDRHHERYLKINDVVIARGWLAKWIADLAFGLYEW